MSGKITLKAFLGKAVPANETEFAELSDKLWQVGSLEEIRGKVSRELFTFHTAGQLFRIICACMAFAKEIARGSYFCGKEKTGEFARSINAIM